jgi:endo-1,4-beta-xylanase
MRRRCFLAAAGAAALASAAPARPALRARAVARGLLFGAMVEHGPLAADPAFAAAIVSDCGIIVPGIEAKWGATEPARGEFRFAALDAVASFAATHGLRLRLHNLVWASWNPPWLVPALAGGQARDIVDRHIDTVAGHMRGRAWAWDVVNEPIDTRWPADADGLCTTPWWHALGPGYIEAALWRAHAADPAARLFVNDDWFEYPACAGKRAKYVRIIERWVARGVPIHGLGLEAHLQPDQVFDAAAYRRFLADIAATGLAIHVTELDVHDQTLPADIARRDQAVADTLRRYLDTTLDEAAVQAVLTWAPTDRYNYQNRDPTLRRADGLSSRGGLLDADLRPKPAWFAVAQALDHAPARRPLPG